MKQLEFKTHTLHPYTLYKLITYLYVKCNSSLSIDCSETGEGERRPNVIIQTLSDWTLSQLTGCLMYWNI